MLRFFPILFLALLLSPPAQASSCGKIFGRFYENSRQIAERKQIEADPKKQLELNYFKVNRPLRGFSQINYESELLESLVPRLEKLTPEDQWVDMGAGEGRALLDYLQDAHFPKKAKIAAVSFKKPESVLEKDIQAIDPNFHYFEGLVENLEISQVGKAKLITDVYGPLHYTDDLSTVLQKYVDVLEPGGEILTPGFRQVGQDGKTNSIHFAVGGTASYTYWLKEIPGLKVIEIPITGDARNTALIIKKVSPEVKIPKLKLYHLYPGSPPWRIFEEVSP